MSQREAPSEAPKNTVEHMIAEPARLAIRLLVYVGVLGLLLAATAFWGQLDRGLMGGVSRAYALVAAGVAAFTVVAFLEQAYGGALSFKVFGFEFERASGPVIMWLICYLGIVASTRMIAP